MAFRRRQFAVALFTLAALLAPAAAIAALDADTAAKDFESKKGPDAIEFREKLLSAAPPATELKPRDDYANSLAKAFESHGLFISTNPDAQLNAAITIAQLKTVSCDKHLEGMLSNKNSAVRYWGAKGLGDISADLMKFGAQDKANKALLAGLSTETSAIVKREIITTLVKLGNMDAMIQSLKSMADSMQINFPDVGTLDDATYDLEQFDKLTATQTLTAAQKTQAAQSAAWIASFALQQERAKSIDEQPKDYHAAVARVVDAVIITLNTLSGKVEGKDPFMPIKGDADTTSLLLGGMIGSASSGPGSLQKIFPGVAVPPAIKPASTQPK